MKESNKQLYSEKRKKLLEKMLEDKKRDTNDQQVRSIVNESGYYPLSLTQRSLWFSSQIPGGQDKYRMFGAYELTGDLNINHFENALIKVLQENEVLRTIFKVENNNLVQKVVNTIQPLEIKDISTMDTEMQEERIRELLESEKNYQFNFEQLPPIHYSLIKVSMYEFIFIIGMHHIISDGTSMEVFMKELSCNYNQNEGSINAPKNKIHFEDYVKKETFWLSSNEFNIQKTFWLETLKNAPTYLNLPLDKVRPLNLSAEADEEKIIISKDTMDKILSLNQKQSVTTFMVLLTTFKVMLSTITQSTDVVVGIPTANRMNKDTKNLMGPLVNTLPLVSSIEDQYKFLDVLSNLKKSVLDLFENQNMPFEKIIEFLNPERSLSYSPIFQVAFNMIEFSDELLLNHMKTKQIYQNKSAKYDLTMHCHLKDEKLEISLEYCKELFEAKKIKKMLTFFEEILTNVLSNPSISISDIPDIYESDDKISDIKPIESNNLKNSNHQSIHSLFEEQVKSTPNNIALVCDQVEITYSELNDRANLLASRLQELGVEPETLVGLAIDRSIDLIVGILGIIKAGGAYVPIDPTYPNERINYILNDSKVNIVVTKKIFDSVLSNSDTHLFFIDEMFEQTELNQFIKKIETNSNDLAYVIYTSGSTGKPKGVLVEHGNVVNLMKSTEQWFNFNKEDIWTLFHSYAFDFSVWEIWGALLYGGKLIIVPSTIVQNPEAFHNLLNEKQVTVLSQTPSAFRQLIQIDNMSNSPFLKSLRYVIFGGEALEVDSLKSWMERYGTNSPKLINMFGTTETTVHATYRVVTEKDLDSKSGNEIGISLPNSKIYILDENQKSVPTGVPGEIYISGPGVSRGYLNRAELTKNRFVSNPFCDGEKLYRTGDLGCITKNGEIEYLGRIDDQVKIRGYRIELGEIESVLLNHPLVKEAFVLVKEGKTSKNDKRLIAYIMSDLSEKALKQYVQEKLPDFMCPSIYVFINSIPLTPNGKLDKKFLLNLENLNQRSLSQMESNEMTDIEKILRKVWEEILEVKNINIDDNFFDLGGDSILTLRVVSMAKERGLTFSIEDFFQFQTIKELAEVIKKKDSVQLNEKVKKLEPFSLLKKQDYDALPLNLEDAYPMTKLQEGMIFHSELNSDSKIYHNLSSFHVKAFFSEEFWKKTIKYMVQKHPVLRTTFDFKNFIEPLQLVHRDIELPINFFNISHLSSMDQSSYLNNWIRTESNKRFDYSNGPLIRFNIHQLDRNEFQFTFSEHHSIIDGLSVSNMVLEIFEIYMSFVNNDISNNAQPLKSSYNEFVNLEQITLKDTQIKTFWDNYLKGYTFRSLKRNKLNHNPQKVGATLELDNNTTKMLKNTAKEAKASLKSIMLTAHLKVLSIIGNEKDIITGVVSNGRTETSDAEKALGLYLNTIPFRAKIDLNNSWIDLTKSVFENESDLSPYRRYPLSEVIQNNHNNKELFETAFNYAYFDNYDRLNKLENLKIVSHQEIAENNFPYMFTCTLDKQKEIISIRLEGIDSIFDEKQISEIINIYKKVLEKIAVNPLDHHDDECLIEESQRNLLSFVNKNDNSNYLSTEEFDVIDKTEMFKLINSNASYYPSHLTIDQLFEQQVVKTPNSIAIVYKDQKITYKDLNEKANRLANRLNQIKCNDTAPICIFTDQSLEMFVGMLAILKIGACFLPLDPNLSSHRLSFMVKNAKANMVLTTSEYLEKQNDTASLFETIVHLDDQSLNSYSELNINSSHSSNKVAYVIYTSGSTGEPKGVKVTHKNLNNYVNWFIKENSINQYDKTILTSSFSFDLGYTSVFTSILSGAELHLLSKYDYLNNEKLSDYIHKEKITYLKLTPTLFSLVTEHNSKEASQKFESLKIIVLGGEEIRTNDLKRIWSNNPNLIIINHYGPTETTIGSIFKKITFNDFVNFEKNPVIGKPISNTKVWIFDDKGQSASVGEIGEIYISGDGVSEGYLNDDKLNNIKFKKSTLFDNALAYKTGDLGKINTKGEVEFLGRQDDQVKIRGFRIELREIQFILEQHPNIKKALVITDDTKEKSILCYLSIINENANKKIDSSEIIQYLSEYLPEYMIPKKYFYLEKIDLKENGKFDKKLLLENRTPLETANIREAKSETEHRLVAIYSKYLGHNSINTESSFFEIGGHSLIATRVVSKIRSMFNVELSLKTFFEKSSILEVAKYIDENSKKNEQKIDEISDLLTSLKNLSDDEVEKLLADKTRGRE